jgi:hypothetical protein
MWRHLRPEVTREILTIFPSAVLREGRFSQRQHWHEASLQYNDDDIIYLHSNDDHAFVAETTEEFLGLCDRLYRDKQLKMAALTHFPEMVGLLARERYGKNRRAAAKQRVVEVDYAIGTVLCRGDFFKSWWLEGAVNDEDRIVRPDNPFGQSVSFAAAKMLIPRREVFRHLDGYSHIGLHRPLLPLRNTRVLARSQNQTFFKAENTPWIRGLWPGRFVTSSGRGVDFHSTISARSDPLFSRLRSSIAHLQACWALRISFREGIECLNHGHFISKFWYGPLMLVAAATPPVVGNLLDKLLDYLLIVVLKSVSLENSGLQKFIGAIWYQGTLRAIANVVVRPFVARLMKR